MRIGKPNQWVVNNLMIPSDWLVLSKLKGHMFFKVPLVWEKQKFVYVLS